MSHRHVNEEKEVEEEEEGKGGGQGRQRQRELEKIVAVNYMNILSPSAFGGISVQQRYYGSAMNRESIKKGLSRVLGYTMKRPWEKRKVFNPTFVYKKRELFQIDLITVSQYARSNGGIHYLLSGIDCFSRLGFVLPLKTKKGEEVTRVFEAFLLQLDQLPLRCAFDRGKEFLNHFFLSMLSKHGIKYSVPKASKHASVCERFNRSFLELLSAYLAGKKSPRFIDDLERIQAVYNGRPHRSLGGLSPRQAEKKENYSRVLNVTLNNYANRVYKARKAAQRRWQRGERQIRLGDVVRVVTDQESVFRKGYRGRYEKELFRVVDINTKLIVPLYKVKRLEGRGAGEEVVFSLYREELQLVSPSISPQNFPSHSVLKVEKDRLQLKWRALPDPYFHVWIPLPLYESLSGRRVDQEEEREGGKTEP